ncbi:unnamed protein product [marine sediment metagenome]|uniref:Uncharacterized protein n=1 Tax=marine sediment metagenome TaxID=412755 RepID=X1H1W0_9ZZZZ
MYLKRLPSAFDGLKIGQITDIHAGPLVPAELIKKGVRGRIGVGPSYDIDISEKVLQK